MMRFLYSLLLLLVLCSGCARQAPLPVDHYYRLPETSLSVQQNAHLSNAIFVDQMETDGLHRERAVLYSEDESAIELKQYHYHHWIDSPTRMIRDHLVAYLRNINAAPLVVTMVGEYVELIISGRIERFERMHSSDQPSVAVELILRLHRQNESRPLLLKGYQAIGKMDDESMQSAVKAFDSALSEIFSEFYTDMSSALN
ncbi:MAG: ABC-type transport auxiliary lipoprotein family protein [Gammaproteobacteria bacterium]